MPTKLSEIFLYRITHIENISHILLNGITHANSLRKNSRFVPIGDDTLISSRSAFRMPNGKKLGSYIPFYFGTRMPMLYVIQKGFNGVKSTSAENIVYCVSSVKKIIDHDLEFVFTDGHAIDLLSDFFDPSNVNNISNIIDKNAINSRYWKNDNDLDLKRRKEAEFLISDDIPISAIEGYIVYNNSAKKKLVDLGVDKENILVDSDYYF